jgi:hypothetical protein
MRNTTNGRRAVGASGTCPRDHACRGACLSRSDHRASVRFRSRRHLPPTSSTRCARDSRRRSRRVRKTAARFGGCIESSGATASGSAAISARQLDVVASPQLGEWLVHLGGGHNLHRAEAVLHELGRRLDHAPRFDLDRRGCQPSTTPRSVDRGGHLVRVCGIQGTVHLVDGVERLIESDATALRVALRAPNEPTRYRQPQCLLITACVVAYAQAAINEDKPARIGTTCSAQRCVIVVATRER